MLIAITVMGGLFGIPGMILGVPIFAVVIELCKRAIEEKLRGKNRETDTTHYYRKGAVGNAEEEVYYEHAHWKYKYDHSRMKPHVDKLLAALARVWKKLTKQDEESPADTAENTVTPPSAQADTVTDTEAVTDGEAAVENQSDETEK